MTKASDNVFPKLILDEAGTLGTVTAGERRLGVDANGVLVWKNSAGTTSPLVALNKWDGTTAPTANEDSGDGYAVGSRWIDTTNDKEYVCLDATAAAAVWTETTAAAGGSALGNVFVGTATLGMAMSEGTLVASRVHFQRFLCLADVSVTTAYFHVSVQGGNLDLGIYNAALDTKLGSTGSFACPVAGDKSRALTGTVALTAGTIYYLAHWTDSATFTTLKTTFGASGVVVASGGWNLLGQQNSVAGGLPTTPTVSWEATTVWPIYFFK